MGSVNRPESSAVPKPRLAVRRFILYDRCIGCTTCEEVCRFINDDLTFIKLYEIEPGLSKPLSCLHCIRAPCVAVCPTAALAFDKSGAVINRPARCIGCTLCISACPFGIPEPTTAGYIVKCDLCSKLRSRGLEPGCVATCPTNSIIWGNPEDIIKVTRRRALTKLTESLKPLNS